MISFTLGKFEIKLFNEGNLKVIKIENDKKVNEIIFQEWLSSTGILLFEHACAKRYYITVPVYSALSLYIKNNIVTDSLEQVADYNRISEKALEQLVDYTFTCAPMTLFKDVKKIPRWSCLILEPTGYSFYPIRIVKNNHNTDFDQLLNECLEIDILNSKNLLAFSGGLDSTLLYYCLRDRLPDFNLYNVIVEGGRDESHYQNLCDLNKKSIIRSIMTENDAVESLISTSGGLELFGCSIALKYDYMFKDARKRGFKNVITGDGPDDLFICQQTLDDFVDPGNSCLRPINQCSKTREVITLPYFDENEISNPWYWYNFILMAETNYYFERVLARNNGVELITPFLTPQLIFYCAENSKAIYSMTEKQLLKKFSQGIVPDEIINRKKMGFTSDVALWFKTDGVFNNLSKKLAKEHYKLPYGNRLAKELTELLELQSGIDYDPTLSTGGKGILNQLYVKMLVLFWLYKIEKGEIL